MSGRGGSLDHLGSLLVMLCTANFQVCSSCCNLSHASLQQDPVCVPLSVVVVLTESFLPSGGGASVAKTLDLLKAVLQSSFNMEVKRLCDDYLQIFNSAALNIRENTQDTVPDATLRLLVCKMLEEVIHTQCLLWMHF